MEKTASDQTSERDQKKYMEAEVTRLNAQKQPSKKRGPLVSFVEEGNENHPVYRREE